MTYMGECSRKYSTSVSRKQYRRICRAMLGNLKEYLSFYDNKLWRDLNTLGHCCSNCAIFFSIVVGCTGFYSVLGKYTFLIRLAKFFFCFLCSLLFYSSLTRHYCGCIIGCLTIKKKKEKKRKLP